MILPPDYVIEEKEDENREKNWLKYTILKLIKKRLIIIHKKKLLFC